MPNQRPSYLKRQKEQQRKARAEQKREARNARRATRAQGGLDDTEIEPGSELGLEQEPGLEPESEEPSRDEP